MGGRVSFWAEHGAETFDVDRYVEDDQMVYRHGDVSRINDWINGVTPRKFNSFLAFLITISALENLNPPPVEPAQAPTRARPISTTLENSGHLSKSNVPKPVVVMTDVTAKRE